MYITVDRNDSNKGLNARLQGWVVQVQGVDVALVLEGAMPGRRCLVQQGHHVRRFKEEDQHPFTLVCAGNRTEGATCVSAPLVAPHLRGAPAGSGRLGGRSGLPAAFRSRALPALWQTAVVAHRLSNPGDGRRRPGHGVLLRNRQVRNAKSVGPSQAIQPGDQGLVICSSNTL